MLLSLKRWALVAQHERGDLLVLWWEMCGDVVLYPVDKRCCEGIFAVFMRETRTSIQLERLPIDRNSLTIGSHAVTKSGALLCAATSSEDECALEHWPPALMSSRHWEAVCS